MEWHIDHFCHFIHIIYEYRYYIIHLYLARGIIYIGLLAINIEILKTGGNSKLSYNKQVC